MRILNNKTGNLKQMTRTVVVGLILAFPFLLIGMLAYTGHAVDDGLARFAFAYAFVSLFAIACVVGAAIAAVIVKCINAVRNFRHRPALPAPVAAEQPLADWRAETFGEHAVRSALRPIWLAKRPTAFNEAELAAWSECAAAFDDEHRQQGWR
jgi:hypothetical protein